MATSPQFISVPRVGLAVVSVANANRDGSGTIVSALTAGANGTRINEVVLQATGDPADSVVTMFIDPTGSAGWSIYHEFDIGNPAAGSTTVPAYRLVQAFSDLVIPADAKVGFAVTVAPTTGVINCWVFAGDF